MYYYKQNQGAEIYFCLLFLFFIFSISQSNVMNKVIFVKDFSGTALPRILKIGTNIRYDKLVCVWVCELCSLFAILFIMQELYTGIWLDKHCSC